MRVYALYDYGDLVDLYTDPETAEADAEHLRKKISTYALNGKEYSSDETTRYIRVQELPVYDAPRFANK